MSNNLLTDDDRKCLSKQIKFEKTNRHMQKRKKAIAILNKIRVIAQLHPLANVNFCIKHNSNSLPGCVTLNVQCQPNVLVSVSFSAAPFPNPSLQSPNSNNKKRFDSSALDGSSVRFPSPNFCKRFSLVSSTTARGR